MTRRFQFSLTSLLVATAVAAVVVNWWTLRQRATAARQRFVDAERNYEVGIGTWLDLTTASEQLLQADLAVPVVPRDRTARFAHLERTRHLYRKAHANASLAMFDEEGSTLAWSRVDEMRKECREIEDRLGQPHIDDGPPFSAIGAITMDDDEDSADAPAPDDLE